MVLTTETRQRLRALRAAHEPALSQNALALRAGVNFHRYWRIEKGYAWPTEADCQRIADALSADRRQLFPEVPVPVLQPDEVRHA